MRFKNTFQNFAPQLLSLSCAAVSLLLFASSATAESDKVLDMTATTYDDGRSCPENCDAHVVFKPKHNNSPNAFLATPGSDPFMHRFSSTRERCEYGDFCAICFGKDNDTCMVARYRGAGPKEGRFDFTPKFMEENCGKQHLPVNFKEHCKVINKNATVLKSRLNCIANPNHQRCKQMMERAVRLKKIDEPRRAQCKTFADDEAYNRTISNKKLHRIYECNYFKNVPACGAENRCGYFLAPAACRDGYFGGPYGTDCCSANPLQAAIDFKECGSFYLE